MKIVEQYIVGLKKAYFDNNAKESWEHFERIIHGASKEDIGKLKDVYPDIPETLIKLLEFVDGTYWREYEGEKIVFYLLGSDIENIHTIYYLRIKYLKIRMRRLSIMLITLIEFMVTALKWIKELLAFLKK